MKLLTIFILFSLIHCSVWEKKWPFKSFDIGEKNYSRIMSKNSKSVYKYNLIQNIFQGTMLFLNSKVQKAIVKRKSFFYQWDENEISNEETKRNKISEKQTSFILSFYVFSNALNNLHISNKKWKVYLFYKDKKINGTVTQLTQDFSHLQSTYPFHSHFNKLYQIDFPLPLQEIENEELHVIITSHIGSAKFSFKN